MPLHSHKPKMASLGSDLLNVERLILRQVSLLGTAPLENIQFVTLNYLAMSLENEIPEAREHEEGWK